MSETNPLTLEYHLKEVQEGARHFENVFQSLSRMILGRENAFERKTVNGEQIYDFKLFRDAKKPIVGMHKELSHLVGFLKGASEGGPEKERAIILIGERGNGKSYLTDFLGQSYKEFISSPGNEKFTFRFKNLNKLETSYGKIKIVESQTFEDPMILAMNLFENQEKGREYLAKTGFTEQQVMSMFSDYRPLGACSDHILNQIREHTDGDVNKILSDFVEVVKVPVSPSKQLLVSKLSAKDKTSASAKDLVGDEDLKRFMQLEDDNNPFRYNVREGILAKSAGGGIHIPDEFFKFPRDFIKSYLRIIQERIIEGPGGFTWPLDTLILGTSNNVEYANFQENDAEGPIVDRCDLIYVGYNTNHKLQRKLTSFTIGNPDRLTTLSGENLHVDPNLNYALSTAAVLTRLPHSDKLSLEEIMNLSAGEVAGDKSLKTLVELINELGTDPDVSKQFGQTGLSERDVGRVKTNLLSNPKTNHGKCMFAGDSYGEFKNIILKHYKDPARRERYMKAVEVAEGLFLKRVKKGVFNAFMDEPDAMEKQVMNYVNMVVIGLNADNVGPDGIITYKDRQTDQMGQIKVDESWINAVEERMGIKTKEQKESFRGTIIKTYGQRMSTDPGYKFMDNHKLVESITELRFDSDIGTEASLAGALANRTNKENKEVWTRLSGAMSKTLGYCPTCAEKTIQYYVDHAKSDKAS